MLDNQVKDLKHDSKLFNWHRKTLVDKKQLAVKQFEVSKMNWYLKLSK